MERFQDMAGYAWSTVGDFHLAQDAAQKAFIQAYVNLPQLRSPEAFAGWLRRIVHSCCIRVTRRRSLPTVPIESAAGITATGGEPLRELERKETAGQVTGAILGLPESLRTALVLHHIGDFSYRQVAAFLGVTESTVTYRLHAARKRLRRELLDLAEDNIREMRVSGTGDFARKVLEGVPRIGFFTGGGDCPEDIALPAVLRTCFRWLGEDYGFRMLDAHGQRWRLDNAYTLFAGTSGAAFRFLWGEDTWRVGGDGLDAAYLRRDPLASFSGPFAAAGYRCEAFLQQGFSGAAGPGLSLLWDEGHARELVVTSIDRGRPVIALGVIGPPEPCIVTGYDDGGAVIIGWSYFQDPSWGDHDVEFEPSGYFRRRGWFDDTPGLVIVGDRAPRRPARDVYRHALEMGAGLMRESRVSGYRAGLDAFSAWADDLADDRLFPAGDVEGLRRRFGLIDPWIWDLAERRWYGAMFVGQAADQMPSLKEELLEVAACFHAEHDMMWEIARLFGKEEGSDEHLRRLADPSIRRQAAAIIVRARHRDEEAAGVMDALARRI